MNDDVLMGKWNQLKGGIKAAFGKLSNDDLTEIEGDSERMLGKLQERYGYSRADAEKAWNDFKNRMDAEGEWTEAERSADRAEDRVEDAVDDAKSAFRRALD